LEPATSALLGAGLLSAVGSLPSHLSPLIVTAARVLLEHHAYVAEMEAAYPDVGDGRAHEP